VESLLSIETQVNKGLYSMNNKITAETWRDMTWCRLSDGCIH